MYHEGISMQDYIIFGHGYNGDVREHDDNLEVITVVSKPVIVKTGELTPPGANLQFYELKVHVIEFNGKRYNVAADYPPSMKELQKAIMEERPDPLIVR
ncbi:hypothetical protein C3369_16415 [Escherichia sp. ESNIH1]|nr:hypothetical protein C3369_16415 [Escherichia sp. ESNIH1]